MIYTALHKAGPELMTTAGASGIITLLFAKSTVGNVGGNALTKRISDGNPELISKNGNINFLRFYPAGTSYNCLLHFS